MADLEAADFENPNPSIHDLFTYYNQIYFEGRLGPCTLQWSSKRMTLCAGVCQYSTYGGCEIRLSEPLLKYRPVSDLKNTLLHEMIHAYLFLTKGNKDHDDHGPCFQHLMMMINDFILVDEERPEDGYAITVYHNFTAEVDLYRTHHWKCVYCSDLIKRAMNRTPSVSDCLTRSDACSHPRCHWHRHQKICGGSYEKIHEPAGYVDKRKKSASFASADSRKLKTQSSNGDDVHLTVDGHKRKMSSTGGTSTKGNKEPPVQVKIASLDSYFCPVQKDEGKIVYTQTTTVEKGTFSETISEGENLSPGEWSGKRKFFLLNDSSQWESSSDAIEDGKATKLRSQSSSSEKEVEESLRPADGDTRKSLGTLSVPSQVKGATLSKPSRKNAAGKEALGICADSPSRKKFKTVNELLTKQTCKEPLVILAWANWVSYESDEDYEEPLINRRTERRKQEFNSELAKKGKTILDTSEDAELVTAEEPQNAAEFPTACKHPLEKIVQKVHISQVAFVDDGEEEIPKNITITQRKHLFIDLSDDENLSEVTRKANNCSKGQGPNPYFVPEQALLDFRDLDKRNPSEKSLTSTTQRATAEINLSPQQVRLRGREESNSTTDVMICPICDFIFRGNERNTTVNKHIDECLAQRA